MPKQLFLFKVTQSENFRVDQLTKEICISNAEKGIETSIIFDLNILSVIRKFIQDRYCSSRIDKNNNFQNLNEEDLSIINQIITIMSELEQIYISPGFALAESDERYTKLNKVAFEIFLSSYLPLSKYKDAYNAIKFSSEKIAKLKEESSFSLRALYVGILLIHHINKFNHHLSNREKFTLYIDTFVNKIGYMNALSSYIAMYFFFDHKNLNSEQKDILKNFIKLSGNGKVIIQNSLNAAQDIMLYLGAEYIEQESYKSQSSITENWILTADRGLALLAKEFSCCKEKRHSRIVALPDNPQLLEQQKFCFDYYELGRIVLNSIRMVNNTLLDYQDEEFRINIENHIKILEMDIERL